MSDASAPQSAEPGLPSSGDDASEEYLRGFVAARYLTGARGRKLLSRVPEAWTVLPSWGLAKRLAAALSSTSRAQRAAALAPELAGLMHSVERREITWD